MPDIKALQDVDGTITYVVEGSVADDGTLLQYTEVPELEIEIDDVSGEIELPEHTHIEADITDLDKYTQAEIDAQQATQDTAIALNTAKVSFPEAPEDGTPYLRQDAGWVAPIEKHYDFVQKLSDNISEVGMNQTTTFQEYVNLTTTVPRDGVYKVAWFYIWSLNDAAQDFRSRILVNGSIVAEHQQEPKDIAGTGVNIITTTGTSVTTSTNQRYLANGFWTLNLTAGINTISIEWTGTTTNDEATIYRAQLEIEEK